MPRGHDLGDPRPGHHDARQRRDVHGAGAVAVLQPVRGDEVRAAQVELMRAPVHHLREVLVGARDAVGERYGCVVARRQEQPVHQRVHRDVLAEREVVQPAADL